MSDIELKRIADEADMIISGYAFKKNGEEIQVLNLNNPKSAAVLDINGEMIETNMDDIELCIVQEYYLSDKELMEDLYA
ncbi:MAG: hypothetical protein IJS61_10510 [Firmicutes bacterium]|nr:hypothetical protein [Bacillota bacterium]